jgi:drug/metabolite transporter (DMT)-like permease
MVSLASITWGVGAVLVNFTTAPASVLIVLRMALAGGVLVIVFARRRPLADFRSPAVLLRIFIMGVCSSASLLLLIVALRLTSVGLALFLEYTAPVWVALAAPRLFGSRTDPVVYPALSLALGGLALILTPALLREGVYVSAVGVACGLGASAAFAAFQLAAKDLTRRVDSVTIVIGEGFADALLMLPLALWQTLASGYRLTGPDVLVALALGIPCTAVATTVWAAGVRRIRIQHASLLGYLQPLSAPFVALLLIGQTISLWTVGGGALILTAGLLIVVFGEGELAAALR